MFSLPIRYQLFINDLSVENGVMVTNFLDFDDYRYIFKSYKSADQIIVYDNKAKKVIFTINREEVEK